MVRLSIPDIIGSVDYEVGGIDVVPLEGGLEELRVVDGAVLFEVEGLVLR